jgi:DNA-binding IclR family transcriptional regulator
MLSTLPDEDVTQIISDNAELLREKYPQYSADLLWQSVRDTRRRGYAFNPGLLMPGSWGIGLPVMDVGGRAVGALSIAAIETRLQEARHEELLGSLRSEAMLLEAELRKVSPPRA